MAMRTDEPSGPPLVPESSPTLTVDEPGHTNGTPCPKPKSSKKFELFLGSFPAIKLEAQFIALSHAGQACAA
jgi:hypothetical protein